MKTYTRVSLCISALLVAVWLFFVFSEGGNGGGQARDGFGPDPVALLLYFSAWIVGLALVHSTVVSLVLWSKPSSAAAPRWRYAALNGVLWLLMASPWILPHMASSYRDFVEARQPDSRAVRAIEQNSPADFEKYFVQALAESPQYNFVGTVIDTAERYGRLNILAALKASGVVVVGPGHENGWIEQVQWVVGSEHLTPGNRLKTVQWLIEEAAPYGYTLQARSEKFSDPELYHSSYGNLKDPDTLRLLDLLIAHGVDINACNETGQFCPLWHAARFELADAVQYLIAHHAPVDKAEADYHTTALGEAIDKQNPAIVKMLLAAGAHITATEQQNDIVSACERATYQPNAQATAVISLLKENKVRMTPDDLKTYRGSYNNDVAACAQPFVG